MLVTPVLARMGIKGKHSQVTRVTHGKLAARPGPPPAQGNGDCAGGAPSLLLTGEKSRRSPVRASRVTEKSFSSGHLGGRDGTAMALRAALHHEGHGAQGTPLRRDLQRAQHTNLTRTGPSVPPEGRGRGHSSTILLSSTTGKAINHRKTVKTRIWAGSCSKSSATPSFTAGSPIHEQCLSAPP